MVVTSEALIVIFENIVVITSRMLFRFTWKHILDITCYKVQPSWSFF